jgi:hypothetical protein
MSRPPSRQMGREVEITIVITAFRGDPMPTMDRIPSSGGEEGEEDADQEKEEPVPPPALEELECRY